MVAVVRTGVLAGMVSCTSLLATPSFAAEVASTLPVPPLPAPTPILPSAPAVSVVPPTTVSATAATNLAAQAAPLARPATTIATAAPLLQPAALPPASKPATTTSLRDLVISYIDRRDQDAEQQCLAQAVFFEARGESLEGQLAVAQVVLNRAASGTFPSSICQVVTQPAQFSFVRRGRIPEADRTGDCWHKALAIADIARKRALAGEVASNVLWYHATYVSPRWGRQKTRFAQIGSHIFYS
jgi:spore germination cell wall hydrolase CwlJ-like protein